MVGFRDLVGTGIAPVSKKTAVKLKVESKQTSQKPKNAEKKKLKVALHFVHSNSFHQKKVCTFANWTIGGPQHQFDKNWLDRQNIGFLSNT